MAVVAFIFGYADTAGLDHLLTTLAWNNLDLNTKRAYRDYKEAAMPFIK